MKEEDFYRVNIYIAEERETHHRVIALDGDRFTMPVFLETDEARKIASSLLSLADKLDAKDTAGILYRSAIS